MTVITEAARGKENTKGIVRVPREQELAKLRRARRRDDRRGASDNSSAHRRASRQFLFRMPAGGYSASGGAPCASIQWPVWAGSGVCGTIFRSRSPTVLA